VAGLRRTADLVFAGAKVAVFLDGCFWHGCAEHYRPSTRNSEFWSSKMEGNRERDAQTDERLAVAGWRVIRVWEHEDPQQAAARVAQAVLALRTPTRAARRPSKLTTGTASGHEDRPSGGLATIT
jgi:DNA mismatch endonuclease (patch repair protein)